MNQKCLKVCITVMLMMILVDSSYNLCDPDGILNVTTLYARSVHLTPTHQYMVVGSHDNSTYVFKFNNTAFQPFQTLSGPRGNVVSVSMSPDHSTMVSGTLDTNTYIYNRPNNQSLFSLSQTISNDGVMVSVLSLQNSGMTLAIGGYTGRVKLYRKTQTGYKLFQTINKELNSVRSLDLSIDASQLAIGYQNGNIDIYKYHEQQLYQKIQSITTITKPITSLSLLAGIIFINNNLRNQFDEHFLVAGSENTVYVFIHQNNAFFLNQTLEDANDTVQGCVIDIYRRHIAVASADNNTYLYERTNGQFALKQTLDDAQDFSLSVSFDAKAQYLAVGSADGKVRIYHSPIYIQPQYYSNVTQQTIIYSQMGIGIGIGIVIGIVLSVIAVFFYLQFVRRSQTGMEILSQSSLRDVNNVGKDEEQKEESRNQEYEMKQQNFEENQVDKETVEVKEEPEQECKKIELFQITQ